MGKLDTLIKKEKNGVIVLLNKENGCWVRMKKDKYVKLRSTSDQEKYLENYLNEKFSLFDELAQKPLDIRSVYFCVTGRCNMSCSFCTMNSGPHVSTENDFTLDEIRENLLSKLETIEPKKIVITGGEPLVRKDIGEILELFSDRFGRETIILQTNGLLLTKELLTKIAGKIGVLEVSIENIFADPALRQQMEEIFSCANEKGVRLSLSFVVDSNSRKYLKEAIEVCHRYQGTLLPRVVSLLGRAKENEKEDEILEAKETLVVHCEIASYLLEKGYLEETLTGNFLGTLRPKRSCGAFGKILSIHPDGTAYMCGNFKASRYSYGNIRELSMEELLGKLQGILDSTSFQKEFYVDHIKMCSQCEVKYFCYGLCAAEAAENRDDPKALEKKCLYRKILLNYMLFYCDTKTDVQKNMEGLLAYMKTFI